MIIKLKRSEVGGLFNALEPLMFPKMNINRSKAKFLKRLLEKEKETLEYRKELSDKYYNTDKDGNVVPKQNVDFVEGNKELNELENEVVEIHGGEYTSNFSSFFEALNNLDVEISGSDAIFIDNLLEQVEEVQDVKGSE